MGHISISKQSSKSPCPQGTGPGGWGDHTEHKHTNIRMSSGGEPCSDTQRGQGTAMGDLDRVAMKRGHRGPEGNEGGLEQNLGRSL